MRFVSKSVFFLLLLIIYNDTMRLHGIRNEHIIKTATTTRKKSQSAIYYRKPNKHTNKSFTECKLRHRWIAPLYFVGRAAFITIIFFRNILSSLSLFERLSNSWIFVENVTLKVVLVSFYYFYINNLRRYFVFFVFFIIGISAEGRLENLMYTQFQTECIGCMVQVIKLNFYVISWYIELNRFSRTFP